MLLKTVVSTEFITWVFNLPLFKLTLDIQVSEVTTWHCKQKHS